MCGETEQHTHLLRLSPSACSPALLLLPPLRAASETRPEESGGQTGHRNAFNLSVASFSTRPLTYEVNATKNEPRAASTDEERPTDVWLYHLMAWGVPLVMASLPLLKGYYGPAGAWCWITDDHVAWRFGIWYVPLFSLIFLMICCYARIICVANARMQSWLGTFNPERERRKVSLAEEIKPLKWYPSVYLLVSIFPLINRLHNAFYPKDPSFSLTLLHVLSAPLHGLANAFVFGLDRDWWSVLSPTGLQLALQSRLCDRTRIGEYHPGAVRYTQADLVDLSDDDDDDTNVLFYSPDMTLKDRGP
ncbi:cyclic AMP receptor 4 [Plectropomus leopardus]|uniref:cyclic AMP receptor 4 n=1 Tax=Plectropomus leopardus TaxID=160734 RepID=UPI001C4D21A2|nr:cyclic AMP receptor 4 [Plectropomus leopardus]